ncbi:MAG: WYL domain-containing protein [Prevotella sp.]|nr:WYL domain-containing protein [Prevotella sp.]
MVQNDRGQSLINKYVWVVETIHRAKKISFKELNRKWLRDDISRGAELPKRTFDNWRYAIWDMFGIEIANENKGEYRYYIENEDDIHSNGIRSWLFNAFSVGNVLANSQTVKDRILLEDVPSGQEFLQAIIEAMKENRVLNITYHSYWKDEENNFDVQPYCVKLFRQRWYLVARSTYPYYFEKGPRIYSLDRIQDLHTTDETFEMPETWRAEDFFDGCFGIIADQSIEPQTVKLKVSAGQANYIRDLALHESQEEVERNEEYSVFEYWLRPSYDFLQEVLWNGEDAEVIEPQWFREKIAGKIQRMNQKYKV